MKRYELIEHTADMGLRAYGRDLPELFENAAYGLFDQVTELAKVSCRLKRKIRVEAANPEELLVEWLNELLYLFSAKKYLFCHFKVKKILYKQKLEAEVSGLKLNQKAKKEWLKKEVKAATYHQLKITAEKGQYIAEVIFDV